MSKLALNIVRVVCLVVVGCFFLSFFVVSCNGKDYHTTGLDAAFGNEEKNVDPHPMLVMVPGIALIVLILISIPSIQNKNWQFANKFSAVDCIAIIGGILGLLLLAIARNVAITEVRGQLGVNDISSYFRTGVGFKISAGLFIVMLLMPFADIFLLKKRN